MKPILIDLSGLEEQFNLSVEQISLLTEQCVKEVSTNIYANWAALAKGELHSTLSEYLSNLRIVDKGRFAKQIVLTGVLPLMVERGASAFDLKEGFKRSSRVKHTIPVYNKKGGIISKGGDWYLTIPFRIGVPSSLGQAGFAGIMPDEVYSLMRKRSRGNALKTGEVPSPYNERLTRPAVADYDAYTHKNSIYDGLIKKTGVYNKLQNTYNTFRRAGENSDPLSWIHKGIIAHKLAEKAVEKTDVKTIVENEVYNYLDTFL